MGEARVLFKTRRFSTFLHVDEDGRDPENLITSFTLIRSVGLLPATRQGLVVDCLLMRSALSFLAAALQDLQPLAAFVGSRVHIRPSCMLIYILFWLRLAGTKPSPPGAQDILSRFNGSWALHPLRSEDGSAVVGTAAVLEQDILPAGAVTLSPLKTLPPGTSRRSATGWSLRGWRPCGHQPLTLSVTWRLYLHAC